MTIILILYECLIYDDIAISTAWTDNIYDLGNALSKYLLKQSAAQQNFIPEIFHEFFRQLTNTYRKVLDYETITSRNYLLSGYPVKKREKKDDGSHETYEHPPLLPNLPPDFVISEHFSLRQPTTQPIIFGNAPATSPKILSITAFKNGALEINC